MGRKINDMTGYTRGRIKVIERVGKNKSGNILWRYECSCGGGGITTTDAIRRISSCGCIKAENGKEYFRKRNTIHGESNTRLYTIWENMINRTTNSKSKDYKNYGGRGITVCQEWKNFLNFKEWALNNGYSEELTIDRMENDKGYSPDNCRWADRETQDNNKRQTIMLLYKGKMQSAEQWAKEYNINRSTLIHRLNRGMSIKEALETPIKGGKGIGYKPKKKEK